jgi:hypothetical protein
MRNVSKRTFIRESHEIATELGNKVQSHFEAFLGFLYDYPIIANKKGGVVLKETSTEAEISAFLRSYLKQYFASKSKRIVLKECGTVPDPAVDVVLEVFGKYNKANLLTMRENHRASMAAENKVGQLLEAYLATRLEPRGWFWCNCSIVKGVDFFKPGTPVHLLQVKNRSNSENSSSQAIRKTLHDAGCPVKIEKWYRTESSTGETCWNDFDGNSRGSLFSEEGFHHFIRTYATE